MDIMEVIREEDRRRLFEKDCMLSLEEQREFDDVTTSMPRGKALEEIPHIEFANDTTKLSRTFKLGRETDGPDDHPR
ncbi:hypothetical protein FNYG_01759 [Fusarium nygamai]|uniref:Uncharacterized protein n=1 Tax=Gibberella nygamai TaxID=42673 RepID=A0A2K0WRP1_GIBNY|nr:hypothetical protein FNYG_01759 [Fusarium nygamai]